MCGVAGLFNRDARPVDGERLRAMREALIHRGPDDSGNWSEGAIGLAHRRLAIRDLSPAGHQPLADPSGDIVVTFNGEIYNDSELRAELRRDFGFRFRSTCDTEVLPLGYLAWKEGLFARLEGMFAIALWDRRHERLTLVRDGIGIKPLFYYADANVVRFGSEIKALLADPDQPRRLTPEGVHKFLAMGYAGPTTTTFDGIKQVPPGTLLTFSAATMEEKRFWQPRRQTDIRSLHEAKEAFAAVWPQVVRDHLVSDVPVGILQSGGIDSTLVSLAANRGSERRTPLFTASFADNTFDEVALAGQVAEGLGAPFHRVPVDTPAEGLIAILRRVVALYDGQVADEASVSLYLLSAAVRQHVTVALSGDGGDEFFAGYPTYAASRAGQWLSPLLPRSVWASLGRFAYDRGAADERRIPLAAKLRRFALGLADGGAAAAHVYWRRLVPRFLLNELYGPALRHLIEVDPFSECRDKLAHGGPTLLDRCLIADQTVHLPGGLLLKSDAMSMAHSLELRVPLLDRRIMDLAGRIDSRVLMSPSGVGKRVLREAVARLGAPEALVRARKRGFNAPLARLLRTDLRPLAEHSFDREVERLSPWLAGAAVRRLWREHRDGVRNHDYTLWPILSFSLALDPETAKAPAPRVAASMAVGAF